jgi:hypothetical protein
MRHGVVPAVLAAAALLAGCGDEGGDGGGGGSAEVLVDILEQNGSGQSGTATLTAEGDGTLVVIETFSPFGREHQPAHIHEGTCADLDPEPAFPLPDLVDGVAGDTVPISIDELREGAYAINIHRSIDQPDLYVACGDIE